MVSLANTGKVAGDLTVLGNGSSATVFVNGESAKSGRSIFSSSTIVTSGSSAIVSLGKLGKVEVAPNSTFTLNFDENGISGDLTSGKLTVISSSLPVSVQTLAGLVSANAGEMVSAASNAKQDDDDDDDDDDGGAAWWLFAIGMGGAVAGILYAVTKESNRSELGGGGTVVSPNL
jgi:hypothetical protein